MKGFVGVTDNDWFALGKGEFGEIIALAQQIDPNFDYSSNNLERLRDEE